VPHKDTHAAATCSHARRCLPRSSPTAPS
jgi:hypothetical protein